jgi:hypothetical protein
LPRVRGKVTRPSVRSLGKTGQQVRVSLGSTKAWPNRE